MQLEAFATIDVGQRIDQLRAAPLSIGRSGAGATIAYAADYDVDPFHEMFFLPTGTLKLAVSTTSGRVLWTRDLGSVIVPGMWLCQVLPIDLNGDGLHEQIRCCYGGDGAVADGATGRVDGHVGQSRSLACKFADFPGEQLLGFDSESSRICFWRDTQAVDSPLAKRRYQHPFYRTNARLAASGYHVHVLGGI